MFIKPFSYSIIIGLLLTCIYSFAHAQSDQTVNNGSSTTAVIFAGAGCTYNWVCSNPSVGLAASGTGNIPAFTAINNGSTPINATITAKPTGPGSAYIPLVYNNTIEVFNVATGANTGTINLFSGGNPYAAALTPDGSQLYIAGSAGVSGSPSTVSVINTATNTEKAIIDVGAGPLDVIVNPAGDIAYTVNSIDNTISEISTATNSVIDLFHCQTSPNGLTISPDGKFLYIISQRNSDMEVMDAHTGQLINAIFIASPENIAMSKDGSSVYITSYYDEIVACISTANYTTTATINVIGNPFGITISPDGTRAYVSNVNTASVSVINTSNNTVIATIPVGQNPNGLCVTPDGSSLYVVNTDSKNISVISTATNKVTATLPLTSEAYSFGNFITSIPTGCPPVTFTITVNPNPGIRAGQATGAISTCAGEASSSNQLQQFNLAAYGLSGNVNVSAPAGFEVSLASSGGFSTTLSVPEKGGALNQIIYVGAAASGTAGAISGNVVLSSPGLTTQTVAVNGFVQQLPSVSKPNDQTVPDQNLTTPVQFSGDANEFDWINDTPSIGLAGSGTGDIAAFKAINKGSSPVTATITVIPKNSGNAYVDNATDNSVTVINTANNQVVGNIPVGQAPYSVAVSPDGNRAYISNILGSSVSVIDTRSNKVIATVNVGINPFGISVSPDSKYAYVANEDSNTVSVISAASSSVVHTIPVDDYPVFTLISPDGNQLFVANQDSQDITVYNTSTYQLLYTVPIEGFEPQQMTITPDGLTLYVATLGTSFCSVLKINTVTHAVSAPIKTGINGHALVLTPDGSKIYVADTSGNNVYVIDTATGMVTAIIPVGQNPIGLSITPDGSAVYLTTQGDYLKIGATITVINTMTDKITGNYPFTGIPVSIGNFISPGTSCTGPAQAFTITVEPEPITLVCTGQLTPLNTIYGTPSAIESFMLTGTNITSTIIVTAPNGFEISTDGINFDLTTSINNVGATVSATIYLRLAAKTAAGSYSGIFTAASAGAPNAEIPIPVSTVSPASLSITADNKTRTYQSPNPPFTVSYSGFVNQEEPSQLTTQPSVNTTAVISSASGSYPIIATGAESGNYKISYIPGILTILPETIIIPNTFTPNGDGINDNWEIPALAYYPTCKLSIFDRYGQQLFYFIGYPTPWDGKYRGKPVPPGTYYYILNLQNNISPISGYVEVIR